jgi:hypothetical protein
VEQTVSIEFILIAVTGCLASHAVRVAGELHPDQALELWDAELEHIS